MTCCAVIVAAGLSSRMKSFKPLLPIHGCPAIVHLLHTLFSSGVSRCIVVTGHRHAEIKQVCSSLDKVTFVHNPNYTDTQMFDSAKLGFAAVPPDCTRVLFTPADVPLIPSEVVTILAERGDPLLFPSYQMRRGHPIALDSAYLPYLLTYTGTGGLRGALASLPVSPSYLVVEDPRILLDMDTPSDYHTLLQYLSP